jgi:hypothetical protein
MWRYAMLGLLLAGSFALGEERTLQLTAPMYFLPPLKAVVVVHAGEPGPATPKHQPYATVAKLADVLTLKDAGPFDLWLVPNDGKALCFVKAYKITAAKNELKLHDYLGVINVKGDGQPRGKLLVTPYDDEGPETKTHTVVQTAADVRSDLVVLPGEYAVWLVPESGARTRKIVDKIRVQPGKTVTVD